MRTLKKAVDLLLRSNSKPIVIAVDIIPLLLLIIVIVTLTNRVMMIISRRF